MQLDLKADMMYMACDSTKQILSRGSETCKCLIDILKDYKAIQDSSMSSLILCNLSELGRCFADLDSSLMTCLNSLEAITGFCLLKTNDQNSNTHCQNSETSHSNCLCQANRYTEQLTQNWRSSPMLQCFQAWQKCGYVRSSELH